MHPGNSRREPKFHPLQGWPRDEFGPSDQDLAGLSRNQSLLDQAEALPDGATRQDEDYKDSKPDQNLIGGLLGFWLEIDKEIPNPKLFQPVVATLARKLEDTEGQSQEWQYLLAWRFKILIARTLGAQRNNTAARQAGPLSPNANAHTPAQDLDKGPSDLELFQAVTVCKPSQLVGAATILKGWPPDGNTHATSEAPEGTLDLPPHAQAYMGGSTAPISGINLPTAPIQHPLTHSPLNVNPFTP